jgi:hypothetical protein
MRYRLSRLALIATAALLWIGCSTTRTLKSDVRSQMYEVTRDTVREEVALMVHDTIREVTTITIRQNEAGDTLKVVQITDRDRLRDRSQLRDKSEKIIVKTDTVYIEKRDSVSVESRNYESTETRKSNFVTSLKWMLAIAFLLLTSVVLARARH